MWQFENGLDIANIKPKIGKIAFGILHLTDFEANKSTNCCHHLKVVDSFGRLLPQKILLSKAI
jgi:hypothetical protein